MSASSKLSAYPLSSIDQIYKPAQNWVKSLKNVLLVGEAGVGKTSVIKQIADDNNLNVKILSGSLIDPHVDLLGIPFKHEDKDGVVSTVLAPPTQMFENIDILFIDELNRAPIEVLNALMEIIQFKTLNGKPTTIKMVWAAINPFDDEEDSDNQIYTVNRMDPAHMDRFQIRIEIPYDVSEKFMKSYFGKAVGSAAVDWWRGLPQATKSLVTPRRLQYAVTEILDCGTSVYCLPPACRPASLNSIILDAYKTEKFLDDLINNKLDISKITKVDELFTLASFMDEKKTIKLFKDNVFSKLSKTQLTSVLEAYMKKGDGLFISTYPVEFMDKIQPFFGSLDEKRKNASGTLDTALHEAALTYIKNQDNSSCSPITNEIISSLKFEEIDPKTQWSALNTDRFSIQKSRKRINPLKCLTEAAIQGVDIMEYIDEALSKEDPTTSGAQAINSLFGGD